MFGIFAYLTITTFRNRLRVQVGRLKQPRYAIALVVGCAYLWYFIFRPRRVPPGVYGAYGSYDMFRDPAVHAVAAIVLLIVVMNWWLTSRDKNAIAFSPAEIGFLVPAPISRRNLIQFKLLRSQASVLISTVLSMLLLGRAGSGPDRIPRAIGIWAIYSVLSLHHLGATLVRTSALENGWLGAKRQRTALVAFGILGVAAVWGLAPVFTQLAQASGLSEASSILLTRLANPIPTAVLYPFRMLIAPVITAGQPGWYRALLPVLGILVLHYLWVVRSDAAFEEAAVDASAARAKRVAAMRSRSTGTRRTPASAKRTRFTLPLIPRGRPGLAIVWKNTLALVRTATLQPVIAIIVFVGIMVSVTSRGGDRQPRVLGLVTGLIAAMLVFMGARMVRNDLRLDMPMLGILKTFPLRGRTMVIAQVISPILVLTLVQMVMVTFTYITLMGAGTMDLGVTEVITPAGRTVLLLVAPVVFLFLNTMTVGIQNAIALMFPSWVRLGPASTMGGVEAIGQNLLTVAASVFALFVTLIPPAVVFLVTQVVLGLAIGFWSALPALALCLATMFAEMWLLFTALGRVFDRAEPLATT